MMALAKLAAFGVFVLLCALIATARDRNRRRRLIFLLIGFFVAIQLEMGLTQHDAWPFTPYRLMHGIADLSVECWRVGFFGVDANGREWRVDIWAWRPMPDWNLQFFFTARFKNLSKPDKEQALRHLAALAERDRAATVSRGAPRPPSPLGPLTAPQVWMFPRSKDVPATPYRSFRVYDEVWLSKDKLAGRADKRTLLGEYVVR